MTTLAEMVGNVPTKLLLIGNPTSGKTTLLATLLKYGYKLNIIDVDAKARSLIYHVPPKYLDKVHVFEASWRNTANYQRIKNILHKGWYKKYGTTEDLGPIKDWTEKDVLVIDSLHYLSVVGLRHWLKENNKDEFAVSFDQSIYGMMGKDILTSIIGYILASSIPCSVIVTSHIRYLEVEMGKHSMVMAAFPSAEGQMISKDISKPFNDIWEVDAKENGERYILTQYTGKLPRRCSVPLDVISKEEEPDLGSMFERIQNAQPKLEG